MSIFQNLIEIIEKKGSAYIVLIDPDKKNNDKIEDIVDSGIREIAVTIKIAPIISEIERIINNLLL